MALTGCTVLVAVGMLSSAAASAARKGGEGAPACSKRKPCDTTPPTIALATPSSDDVVSGTVDVSGSATDNVGVDHVAVAIDGVAAPASGTTSWRTSIDTSAFPDGSHTIVATATDAAGNVSTVSRAVTFSNAAPEPVASGSTSPAPSDPVAAPAMAAGTIAGWTFQETDRDGVFEVGEVALADQRLYLYDGAGAYLATTLSNSEGWYEFTGRADATYEVRLAPPAWWALRADWVPDTTGSLLPVQRVALRGTARADLGWRPIVRSTTAGSPISTYTAANGLVVESYNDAVTAEAVHEALAAGSLIGAEAEFITVRFAYSASGSTASMAVQSNGVYTSYHATVYVPYVSWLDSGDRTLFHEYGHAWSLYYAHIVQQDPTLSAYLEARGVAGDARVGTSYGWDPKEMIAEDYRQLFGSPNARQGGQINTDLPPAQDVAGLAEFLRDTFTNPA